MNHLCMSMSKSTARVFQPSGLKVLFALFCDLELVNAPYRAMVKVAEVALGTVGRVVTDLRELGYIHGGLGLAIKEVEDNLY